MGRPLYSSILLARQAPPVKESLEDSQQPQAPVPVVEKWSRWNAFDPDSDEFFQSEDAVYEAFLTEEQIVEGERARRDERARLTAERMVREGGPANSGVVEGTDLAEATNRAPASGIELYFMGSRAIGTGEGQTRTQPSGASSLVIPQINVAPSDSQNEVARSPSPDPLNLVSGLPHLSESPGPMEPQELPSDPVSPVPDTPARVSGIFNTTHSPRPGDAGPVTSQFLTLYDQLGTPAWDNSRRYRLPTVPAPLTS